MAEKKVIRTAVIGAGGRGKYFGRLYRKEAHPGFDLRAICDLDPDRLKEAREFFGDGIAYRTDSAKIYADPEIDAVLVATDDRNHVEPTLAGLAAGKHVLVEKPLCQTTADAGRIIAAARKSPGIFMIGFELRECTVFQSMKRLLKEGRIGPVLVAHSFDNVSVGGHYFFHSPHRQKAYYRSLLLQKACHSLDLLNWFVDSEPVKVYGIGGLDFYGRTADPKLRCRDCDRADCPYRISLESFQMDYDARVRITDFCVWSKELNLNDNSELCISYASGAKATFHECHFTPEYSREFWLVGPKGKMYGYYDNPGRFLIRIEYSHDRERRTEEFKPPHTGGSHGGGDLRLRDEFYRRIVENDPPTEVQDSAYYSTALAICAEESIESGRPVEIPGLKSVLAASD